MKINSELGTVSAMFMQILSTQNLLLLCKTDYKFTTDLTKKKKKRKFSYLHYYCAHK